MCSDMKRVIEKSSTLLDEVVVSGKGAGEI